MTWWDVLFSWPTGQVWGNLVSNPLWGIPAFAVHHVLLRRHHDRKTDAQTQALKEHITTTLGGPQQ